MDTVIQSIASNDAVLFASSRNEAEPTFDQKCGILLQLIQTKPARFLERYGNWLGLEQLVMFRSLSEDYEVQWYVKQLSTKFVPASAVSSASARKQTRNRRLHFISSTISAPYFSEDAMRQRRPLLYHQFIGRFETAVPFHATVPLSQRLLHDFDREQAEARERMLPIAAQGMADLVVSSATALPMRSTDEEFDSSDDEMETTQDNRHVTAPTAERGLEEAMTEDEQTSADREGFLRVMRELFVDGYDSDWFAYADVDDSVQWDDLQKQQADAEERYFDED
eukprot:TRINITY_DN7828_c0_g2_i1.p1 TRINITY_DN7828_c0_g2~~TRINITY_DN7828_c0_g2_i1.p1  ORF type:complete len:281 (-),score=64.73 TRINITY_DN7828_c0_g2_i1:2059-2901(-)